MIEEATPCNNYQDFRCKHEPVLETPVDKKMLAYARIYLST